MIEETSVLYVAGTGRSGSTLLADVIGEAEGFVSVGELRHFWSRGIKENWVCGCGVRFLDCPRWSAVLRELEGDVDFDEMARLESQLTGLTYVPKLVWHQVRNSRTAQERAYVEGLQRLYRATAREFEARVIVDSSKTPTYGVLLSQSPRIRLTVLHLVRDPRASAYSWQRVRLRTDTGVPREMTRFSTARATAIWLVWNVLTVLMFRPFPYLRASYEDVVRSPTSVLAETFEFLGMSRTLSWLHGSDGRTVMLTPTHSVSGNPSRLERRTVVLRTDEEWRDRLPTSQRMLVTLLAGWAGRWLARPVTRTGTN